MVLVEVLVLTHEESDHKFYDTYLWEKLSPARPTLCFGRAAKRDPQCLVNKAVWHWWQDRPSVCGILNP